ncbi:hypothetical protein [Allorhodopirellula heiligendammensis]|uniref:Transmembrane protein n=1 Tax=Allorhodopirellula heiligendammensis TaxID=2714739 RepID=A0A5C6C3W2_9BACT|nr:hypothetical protein [Allorhodopirellula heiligendammensis]TWU18301.1 hypothetical protein Poly21_04630 [Allorhodopirellula heiligendammensis]
MTTLRLRDPLLFLFGVRSSIQRVLRCPKAIWLALTLVATAAIAREYDAVSWLHDPRDLVAPFAASLLIGSIVFLFVMIGLVSIGRNSPSVWRDYRVFMTGYWMTAPLAWLYAIPIESMADEVTALKFNLTMLSVVSIWRVLLFSRVVAIQFGVPMLAVMSWVLLPCMMIAFVALLAANLSMVSIMGGIRLTQAQQILVDYQGGVAMICYYGVIPTLVIGLVAIGVLRGKHAPGNELPALNGRMRRRVWWLPITASSLLLASAVVFQPRLYRATEVDTLLRGGHVVEAIDKMQKGGEQVFPIVWDPPPRFPDRDSQSPTIAQLIAGIENTQCPRWIVDRLLVQADEIALRQEGWYQGTREQGYLQRHFPQHDPEQVMHAIESLQELQRLDIGDAATIAHRATLLQTLAEVRKQAEFNAAESGPRSDKNEDQTPIQADDD